jgi:hypothetical protein
MITSLQALPNLTASEAQGCMPWAASEAYAPYENFSTKDDFRKWCKASATKHCFYSGFAGKNPDQRVSANKNPATIMQAFVVDVDETLDETAVETWIEKQEFKPNFTSRTFSNKWRLVYLMDSPFSKPKCGWENFLATAWRKLDLSSLSSEVDEKFLSPSQYYELGCDWKRTSEANLTTHSLSEWAKETEEALEVEKSATTIAGLEKIAELVREKFPDRWIGEFVEGARGPRFWDPLADCPSATVVRPKGMRCFTGPKDFLTWKEIFGDEAIAALENDTFSEKLNDVWFDGKNYWRKTKEVYLSYSRQDTRLWIVNEGQFKGGRSDESPADKALLYIQSHQRVAGVAPFLYKPVGPIQFDGVRHLNTSQIKPAPPHAGAVAWSESFPYIASFYERFFDVENREVFLTWLRHFYSGALSQEPNQGHAMVLVGKVGTGKNFHSEMIVGRLMGGSVDAGGFVTGEDSWSRHYLESPLLRVDDEAGIESREARRKYIANMKKLVANRRFTVSEKYQVNSATEWMGRVLITLNPDGESLALLPSLDQGNQDKVCFLRTEDTPMEHPPKNIATILEREMPFFARWLLDWQPPERLKLGGRFGFEAYQTPDLLQESELNSDGAQFEELLVLFAKQCATEPKWGGSATELHAAISGNSSLAPQIRNMTPALVGRQLGKLKTRDYLKQASRKRSRGWEIDLAALRE